MGRIFEILEYQALERGNQRIINRIHVLDFKLRKLEQEKEN